MQKLENILWRGNTESDKVGNSWAKLRVSSSDKESLIESAQILVVGVSHLCVLGRILDGRDLLVGGHQKVLCGVRQGSRDLGRKKYIACGLAAFEVLSHLTYLRSFLV